MTENAEEPNLDEAPGQETQDSTEKRGISGKWMALGVMGFTLGFALFGAVVYRTYARLSELSDQMQVEWAGVADGLDKDYAYADSLLMKGVVDGSVELAIMQKWKSARERFTFLPRWYQQVTVANVLEGYLNDRKLQGTMEKWASEREERDRFLARRIENRESWKDFEGKVLREYIELRSSPVGNLVLRLADFPIPEQLSVTEWAPIADERNANESTSAPGRSPASSQPDQRATEAAPKNDR